MDAIVAVLWLMGQFLSIIGLAAGAVLSFVNSHPAGPDTPSPEECALIECPVTIPKAA
jgi:hypothetical protein